MMAYFKHINLINMVVASYPKGHIYLRIFGWTSIYVFSSMDENDTSVMSRIILLASFKINN